MPKKERQKQGLDLGFLTESVGYLLRRVNRKARDLTIPVLVEHELSPLELTTLYLIQNNPNCALRDLAKAAYVESPAMNRLLNGLKERQLITREKSVEDARYILINITATGSQRIADTEEDVRQKEVELLSELSPLEKKAFVNALKVLSKI